MRAQFRDAALCLVPPFSSEDNERWDIAGGAKVHDQLIQLTPNLPGRFGTLWSQVPLKLTDWKVTFKFHITGDHNVGGEGLAFWYVKRKMMGSVFGGADYWDGLGIFFDTVGAGLDIPAIIAIYNDGTQRYNAYDNGISQALGKCNFPIRNSEEPLYAEIIYLNQELSVNLALDFSSDGFPNYSSCFKAYGIKLGLDKFFGFTSATPALKGNAGIIGDKHVIYSIVTMNFNPVPTKDQLENKREEYRKEVEEEHMQVPKHHDITEGEFRVNVLSLLNQIQNQLEMLDQSQIAIENLLQSVIGKSKNQDTSYSLGQDIKDHISGALKTRQASYTQKISSQKDKNDKMKNRKHAVVEDISQQMSEQLSQVNKFLNLIQAGKNKLISDGKYKRDSSSNIDRLLQSMSNKLDLVDKIPDVLRVVTNEQTLDVEVSWTVWLLILLNLAGTIFLIFIHFHHNQRRIKSR